MKKIALFFAALSFLTSASANAMNTAVSKQVATAALEALIAQNPTIEVPEFYNEGRSVKLSQVLAENIVVGDLGRSTFIDITNKCSMRARSAIMDCTLVITSSDNLTESSLMINYSNVKGAIHGRVTMDIAG